jgi:hypothetical protein
MSAGNIVQPGLAVFPVVDILTKKQQSEIFIFLHSCAEFTSGKIYTAR